MKIYAFDVDETLEVSRGPVTLTSLMELKRQGHILGLCGNWARLTTQVPLWHQLFSFLGPIGLTKADFLKQIKAYCPAEEYIMVGNNVENGISPNDLPHALEAGWRFIPEVLFAMGHR